MRIRITLAAVLTTAFVLVGAPAHALPVPAPGYSPLVQYPNVAEVEAKALANVDKFYRTVLWNDTVERNREVEQRRLAAAATHPAQQHAPSSSAPVQVSTSSSGHDPCAAPELAILPSYIVQRESRGQCGAYNAGGCSGRGCIGWAQVDAGHFWLKSPWGGKGTCYGLSYNDCVIKLSNGGTNLAPWGG